MSGDIPPLNRHQTSSQHIAASQDLLDWLRKHAKTLSAQELLALAANMVGKIMALQNQEWMTPEMCAQLVATNMATGTEQMAAYIAEQDGKI